MIGEHWGVVAAMPSVDVGAAWKSTLDAVMGVGLMDGWLPTTVYVATAVAAGLLVAAQLLRLQVGRLLAELLVAALAGGVGAVAAWLIGNKYMVFGIYMGWTMIWMITVTVAVVGWAIATAVLNRGWRRVVAIVLVPLALLSLALRIVAVTGQYRTVGSLFDYGSYESFESLHDSSVKGTAATSRAVPLDDWLKQVADGRVSVPAEPKLVEATIPATVSGFKARPALVWLPPAALAEPAAQLPVFIMLAGQPGSPGRFFDASDVRQLVTKYAATHGGVAPIIVSPDQNGDNTVNSLCANTTTHGAAETYLTVDVPNWIRRHLPVAASPDSWVIGGYSQGGTCAVELGPNHPDLFGTVLSIGAELQPTDGNVDEMVSREFNGDRSAYDRLVPVNAIAAHAPSTQTLVMGSGAEDRYSLANIGTIGDAAAAHGWQVVALKAYGTAHTWKAANAVFTSAVPWLCDRLGLGGDAARQAASSTASAATNHWFADNTGIEVIRP
ncbi:alpha/beta hydrolase [Bifidobacterium choloepi]|uniref:Esterase family protein n=1 Tax=Bifidobacterium choloepi TaxID=2614131 RepID=A0A6I5MYS2_9BIFI|nr:alpha/beta hydrolase-fold protein [Bifidobacterium choloepi]NEG69778.1 esterase family protein [Bifidobacterium choloepi]